MILAGFGRVGQIVARILNAHHIPFAALERDAEQVDFVRRFGNQVFYGDATRLDLLRAAQADKAEIFVIATENPEENLRTARMLKRHFPHLKVFARARNRQHVFRLMDLNVDGIVRDTFFSSLEIARHVLDALGYDEATADGASAPFPRTRRARAREPISGLRRRNGAAADDPGSARGSAAPVRSRHRTEEEESA